MSLHSRSPGSDVSPRRCSKRVAGADCPADRYGQDEHHRHLALGACRGRRGSWTETAAQALLRDRSAHRRRQRVRAGQGSSPKRSNTGRARPRVGWHRRYFDSVGHNRYWRRACAAALRSIPSGPRTSRNPWSVRRPWIRSARGCSFAATGLRSGGEIHFPSTPPWSEMMP